MKQIINGKIYDTRTATVTADNHFKDGSNRLNVGRGTTLYKTPRGSFFAFYETCWQGEWNRIEPLSIEEAKTLFEEMVGDPNDYPAELGIPEEA